MVAVPFGSGYAHIPWDDIAGMRDKLVHDYFGVDIEKVWLTATEDLPTLKREVSRSSQSYHGRRLYCINACLLNCQG